jgi:hypothetical protein
MAEKPKIVVNKPIKMAPIVQDLFPTPEIFASEIAGVGVLHGNIIVTLANPRVSPQVDGRPSNTRHVVAGRVVLTSVAAKQLLKSIEGLAEKMKSAVENKPNEP